MPLLYIGISFLFVLINGFFVATEFAIVKVRATRLKSLEEEGKPGAKTALRMVEKLDAYLSATQFGITLASLGLGWLGERGFARLFEAGLGRLWPGASGTGAVSHYLAGTLSFASITFLHIVLGELAPKSFAIQRAEATTLAVAVPMRMFYTLFYPGIWLLNGMAGRVLRLLGLGKAEDHEEAHSEEELKMIVSSSAAAGAINSDRAELLERALAMMQKTVRQVLVPRNQVRFLDLDEPLEKNVEVARAGGHTWLPVCRGSVDQVEGLVNVKDLFFLLSRGELRTLAQVQRPVLFVPENVPLDQLLAEFRRRRRQLAVVVDEHGGTTGIVTIADVVAEVVGNVAESGRREVVKTLPGGRLELPGTVQLDDLRERLDVHFDVDSPEVTTIAGYLMAKLARVPRAGDLCEVDEYEVRVVEVDGPRVVTVRIEPRGARAAVPPRA